MKRNYYYLAAAVLTAAALLLSIILYPRLPQQVPVHWGLRGEVDRYGDKAWAAFLGPIFMFVLLLLFRFMPWLSPRQFEIDATRRPTYLYIMLVLVGLFGYIHLLTLLTALQVRWSTGRAMLGGIFLILALVGNVLGKVPRNFYVGVRTPWTIADDRVWSATHRLAARLLVSAGLLGFLAVVLRGWTAFGLILVVVALFLPVFYSLILYKRYQRRES